MDNDSGMELLLMESVKVVDPFGRIPFIQRASRATTILACWPIGRSNDRPAERPTDQSAERLVGHSVDGSGIKANI